MARYSYKFNLIDFWRIGELESWYEHMAEKGYILHEMGRMMSKFKKGEPQALTYRIEVTPKQHIEEDHLHLLEDSGWDYVSSEQFFHVFCAPKERNVPEIHSDPTEQAESLQPFFKVMKRNAMIATFIILLCIPLLIFNFFISEAPLYFFLAEDSFMTYIPILFFFIILFDSWRGVFKLKQLQRQLQNGIPIKHQVAFKRRISVFLVVLMIAFVNFISILFSGVEQISYDEIKGEAPVVRLESIETDSTLHYDEELVNDVEAGRTLFLPKVVNSYESKRSKQLRYEYDGMLYEPSITNDYYKMPFSNLTNAFLDSLIEYNHFLTSSNAYVEHGSNYFDRLIILEEGDLFRHIFVTKDEHVLNVMYHGFATTDELIEQIEKTFKQMKGMDD